MRGSPEAIKSIHFLLLCLTYPHQPHPWVYVCANPVLVLVHSILFLVLYSVIPMSKSTSNISPNKTCFKFLPTNLFKSLCTLNIPTDFTCSSHVCFYPGIVLQFVSSNVYTFIYPCDSGFCILVTQTQKDLHQSNLFLSLTRTLFISFLLATRHTKPWVIPLPEKFSYRDGSLDYCLESNIDPKRFSH